MRPALNIFLLLCLAFNAGAQTIDNVTGSYITIDSTSSSYEIEGKWYKDIDTTLLILKKDMTFTYKWSPMLGAWSKTHIVTTGTWKFEKNKVVLNSKYQQDEHRFFESYKPEYGDSLVKIYVQTYDSLVGFFPLQFIGVIKDKTRDSKMIFLDKDYPYNACSATFHLKNVDKIYFYGDFGRMPVVVPKDKNSNHFLLQYNLSDNWDYQYFKDLEAKLSGNTITLGDKTGIQVVLKKISPSQ